MSSVSSPYVDKNGTPISLGALISVNFADSYLLPPPLNTEMGIQSGTVGYDADIKVWRFMGDGIVVALDAISPALIEVLQ